MWVNARQREQHRQRPGCGKTGPGQFLVVGAQEARVGELKWGWGAWGTRRRLGLT